MVVAHRAAKLLGEINNINSHAVSRTKNGIWDTPPMPNINMHHQSTENVGNALVKIIILVSECRHHGQTLAKIDQAVEASDFHALALADAPVVNTFSHALRII